MTTKIKFIDPVDYNGTDLVARISMENAKTLTKLMEKDDERQAEISQILKDDTKNGFIAEDIDED